MRAWWRDLHAEMEGYAQAHRQRRRERDGDHPDRPAGDRRLGRHPRRRRGLERRARARSRPRASTRCPSRRSPTRRSAPDGTPREPLPAVAGRAQGEVRPRQRQGRGRRAAGRELQGGGVSVKCSEVTVSADGRVEPASPCSAASASWRTRTRPGRQADRRLRQQGRRRPGELRERPAADPDPALRRHQRRPGLADRARPRARSRTSSTSRSPSPSPRRRPCRASRRSSPRTPQGPAGAGPCRVVGGRGAAG